VSEAWSVKLMFSELKLETRKSKLADRELRTGSRGLGWLRKVASNFQFPVSTFEFRISNFELPIYNFQFAITGFRKLACALFTTFALLADATTLQAQSCAMCYNTAAAAKAAAIQALRSGILILLVPVAVLFIGIFFLVFRSKERFTEPSAEPAAFDHELRNWKSTTWESRREAEDPAAREFPVFARPPETPQRRGRRDKASFEFRHPVPGGRTQP
jgi:hypothetical protein